MKKLIFSMALLAAISATSCKKSYECSCTSTDNTTYSTFTGGTASQSDIDDLNDYQDDIESDFPSSTKYVKTTDKTTKADINADCGNSTSDKITTNVDNYDFDSDANFTEPGYKKTVTTTTECSVSKK